MREILFRGKSLNDGNWVYGSLVITTIEPANGEPTKQYCIEDTTIGVFPNEFQSGLSEMVLPETVGQFTGIVDKNNKNVFEGDFIGVDQNVKEIFALVSDGPVIFSRGCFSIGDGSSILHHLDTICDYNGVLRGKVVGNIYDNPDLLKHEEAQNDS